MMDLQLPTMEKLTEIFGFDPSASYESYNLCCRISDMVKKCRKGEFCSDDIVNLLMESGVMALMEAVALLTVTLSAVEETSSQLAAHIKEMHDES